MTRREKIKFCTHCGAPMLEKESVCSRCGAKNKKKFPVWIVFTGLVVCLVLALGTIAIREMRPKKIVWDEIVLKDRLPRIDGMGEVFIDDGSMFSVDLVNCSQQDFDAYVLAAKQMGYDKEAESEQWYFRAFDEDGYELSVDHYDDQMSVSLYKPMELGTLYWSNSPLAQTLPVPFSEVGVMDYEDPTGLSATVQMDLDEFHTYVDECMDRGYDQNYNRDNKSFMAQNEEGNELSVFYEGNNRVSISLRKYE